MSITHSRNKAQAAQEKYGIVEDTGKRNVIFIIRMLSERKVQNLKLWFIDYAKAFDKVRRFTE